MTRSGRKSRLAGPLLPPPKFEPRFVHEDMKEYLVALCARLRACKRPSVALNEHVAAIVETNALFYRAAAGNPAAAEFCVRTSVALDEVGSALECCNFYPCWDDGDDGELREPGGCNAVNHIAMVAVHLLRIGLVDAVECASMIERLDVLNATSPRMYVRWSADRNDGWSIF